LPNPYTRRGGGGSDYLRIQKYTENIFNVLLAIFEHQMALLLLLYVNKYLSYKTMKDKNDSLEKQLLEIQNHPRLSKATKQEFIRFFKLYFDNKNRGV
jgi:hypothetical protein